MRQKGRDRLRLLAERGRYRSPPGRHLSDLLGLLLFELHLECRHVLVRSCADALRCAAALTIALRR
jgi:hypothetical protein